MRTLRRYSTEMAMKPMEAFRAVSHGAADGAGRLNRMGPGGHDKGSCPGRLVAVGGNGRVALARTSAASYGRFVANCTAARITWAPICRSWVKPSLPMLERGPRPAEGFVCRQKGSMPDGFVFSSPRPSLSDACGVERSCRDAFLLVPPRACPGGCTRARARKEQLSSLRKVSTEAAV